MWAAHWADARAVNLAGPLAFLWAAQMVAQTAGQMAVWKAVLKAVMWAGRKAENLVALWVF